MGYWRLALSALWGWQVPRGVEVSRAEGSTSQSTRAGTTIAILKLMVTQKSPDAWKMCRLGMAVCIGILYLKFSLWCIVSQFMILNCSDGITFYGAAMGLCVRDSTVRTLEGSLLH